VAKKPTKNAAGAATMAAVPDKEKALELALAQIDKQYGKGSIMRLGERQVVEMPVIPTGSIALDVALGVGGLPRGRVVEIYGPEASGKCLTGDTYLWTDLGLETVAELFARCGQAASCTSRVTDVSALGLRMVNEQGELEPVAALTHNNRKRVTRLTLRSGRTITATANHPLRVMDAQGYIAWRTVGQMRPGDTVVSARFGAVEAAAGDGLSEDEAVLLGYLVAEGSLSSTTAIRFTNWDPEVSGEYRRLMEQLFGVEVRNYDDKEFVVHGKALRGRFATEYGLDYVTAHGKTVPYRVRTAGHKVQRAFLSALFEGDGWIDTSSTIGLGTASEQLAREVQLMLYGLGIPATVASKWNESYQRHYWSVTVNPAVTHRFLAEIGFRSARRAGQVERCFRQSRMDPRFENIPHLSGLVRALRDDSGGDREFDRVAGDLFRDELDLACSVARLRRIVAWGESRLSRLSASGRCILMHLRHLSELDYTYEDIVTVEDAGEQPTFDVMLPATHSFLANGVLSHNTTVALHAVANAQRAGGIAAFIDAEHALDPEYAKAIGVDTDSLLVSQPDTGEQALEIADMLIRSGALDVIVIDSVAALVPRAEIEGEMGDSHVGLQARLMSQALRKITGALNHSGTTAIFINQLREKVGVMFGCGAWDTRVTLADGAQEFLGKIVNQRMDVEVLSYDPQQHRLVPRRIVNWFDNGKTEEFLYFKVERAGGGTGHGYASMWMTHNHLIRTPGGWREAGELGIGDRVMLAQPHMLSDSQWEVVLGSVMGDGNLSPPVRKDSESARFRMGHGAKQADYLEWKVSLLGNIPHSSTTNSKGAVFADFTPLAELNELRRAVYLGDGRKHLSWDYLKALTPLSLAIWYLDDGCFTVRSKGVQARTRGGTGRIEICVEAMSEGSRERLVDYLRDAHGLDVKLTRRGQRQISVLQFTTAATTQFQEMVAPYVPTSMDYKMLPRFRGKCTVEPQFALADLRLAPARIVDIGVRREHQRMNRYDIEIEGSHNYLADGIMVHNSPETTSGGRALKFYSSVRLDVRRIESLKDGTDVVGNRTRVKVVKNKVASPFKQAEMDIIYGKGISREGSLIDVGVEQGLIRKSGAWYTYDGDQLGQGKENARGFLKDNPDVAAEVEKKILEKLGVGQGPEAAGGAGEQPLPPVDF
jgi:recombination protein RecA